MRNWENVRQVYLEKYMEEKMKNVMKTPTYEEVFGIPSISLDDLLKKIPTKPLIVTLAVINAQVEKGTSDTEILDGLFRFIPVIL